MPNVITIKVPSISQFIQKHPGDWYLKYLEAKKQQREQIRKALKR